MSRSATGRRRQFASALLATLLLVPASTLAAADVPGRSQALRLELRASESELYVGQLEPVEIRLVVPPGIELGELTAPELSGPGFTLSPLADEQPVESQEEREGVPVLVLTWRAAVSAVKPGMQLLEARIDGSVVVRESPGRGSRSRLLDDSLFGRGSLFESFFGRRLESMLGTRRRPFHLETGTVEVAISELPIEGRPEGFSGAVGEFSITARTASASVEVGEPAQLVVDVAGRGNFDRVAIDGLASGDALRSYAPSARFEAIDATGLTGRKRFTQTIVPREGGPHEIPPLRFCYFDPTERRFVTQESEPLALLAVGAALGGAREAPEPGTDGGVGLAATAFRSDPGRPSRSMRPLFFETAYLLALALPVALVAVAGIAARLRRRSADPERAARRTADRIVNESLRRLEVACRERDPRAFFDSARTAIRTRMAQRLAIRPEAVTVADVDERLAASPRVVDSLRHVLENADAIAYARAPIDSGSLDTDRRRVREALDFLEGMA